MVDQRAPSRFLKRKSSFSLPTAHHGPVALERVTSILHVPGKDRTREMLAQLAAFTSEIKVFREMNEGMSGQAHWHCCEMLESVEFAAGQFVFHEGDAADNFYVIISGSVSVLVSSHRASGREEMKQLAVLREGESFGELALISNQPRMAGILCREQTCLAYLSKKDYNEILAKIQVQILEAKVKLLWRQPIFRHLSKIALQRLTYHFAIKHYKRKQIAFKSGEVSSHLYLIKAGEFQLTKDIALPFSPRSSKVKIDVTLLSTGELIGSEDMIGRRPYSYTCMCHSTDGELMAISQTDFYRLVGTEETIYCLSALGKTREQYRSDRVQSLLSQVERTQLSSPRPDGSRLSMEPSRTNKDLSALSLSPRAMLSTNSELLISLEQSGMRANRIFRRRGLTRKEQLEKSHLKPIGSTKKRFIKELAPSRLTF